MARYIDADALKIKYSERHFKGEITNEEYFNLIIPLDYAPTADVVERKKGKWIPKYKEDFITWHVCSNCGDVGSPEDAYCSTCGADMRGDRDE